jgi:multidrug resistance efflux pump
VTGIIGKSYLTEGAFVKQGQVLLQINNPTLELNKNNALLAANYNALQNNADKLQELAFNIEVARRRKDSDSLLYLRQINLWEQTVGSKVELEERELQSKSSKNAYQVALLKYQELQKQLDFAARQSAMNVAITTSQAGDLLVKSLIAGRVFSVLKKQGEMVTAQTPIAIIGESNDFYLELQVEEYDIAQVNEGQKILLSMDSYRGQVLEAVVSKIYPIMNEKTKTFTIEANFLKKPAKIYPNLTAEANIVIITKEKALLIPRNYLVEDQFVLLENGEKRKVQTGLKDYQKVEILGGISNQDAIIKPAQ